MMQLSFVNIPKKPSICGSYVAAKSIKLSTDQTHIFNT